MSIFGSILKTAVGFATGGPVGAATALASDIFKPKAAGSVMTATPPAPSRTLSTAINIVRPTNIGTFAPTAPASLPGIGLPRLPGLPNFGPGNNTQSGGGSSGALVGSGGPHAACQAGYHYNRTGYYTKRYGWIAKGTVCVKNRRRNPLNPRALSKAMGRIHSAKKAAHFLDRIHIGPKPRKRTA